MASADVLERQIIVQLALQGYLEALLAAFWSVFALFPPLVQSGVSELWIWRFSELGLTEMDAI